MNAPPKRVVQVTTKHCELDQECGRPPRHVLPFLKLVHVQEAVAILPGQLELRRQREHGLVEVPEHCFHRSCVLVTVVDVVVEADKLPVGSRRSERREI